MKRAMRDNLTHRRMTVLASSIRPLKIKLYTYEMILVNLKSITYFRYIILTKEQTTLRNCRNNYSGDIIKLKFLTDDR